ncbi:MAG TPA: hypothetical protein VEL07_12860 [Planctomycetota bacterium]|nr:hypothetical protein [Planctomycetota bacterium]
MRPIAILLVASASLTAAAAADAAQVRIRLTDGHEIVASGVEREADGDVIATVVQRASDGRRSLAVLTYPAARVQAVEPCIAEEEYQRRLARVDDPASEAGLAAWCRENGLDERASDHARAALEREPGLLLARQELVALGLTEVDGRWLTDAEILAAGGTTMGGRAVTADEAGRRRGLAAARHERERTLATIAADQAGIAAIDDELAALAIAGPRAAADLPEARRAGGAAARHRDEAARLLALAQDDYRPATTVTTTAIADEPRQRCARPLAIDPVLLQAGRVVARSPDPSHGVAGATLEMPDAVVIPLPRDACRRSPVHDDDRCRDERTVVVETHVPAVGAEALAQARHAHDRAVADLAAREAEVAALLATIAAANDRPPGLIARRATHEQAIALGEARLPGLEQRIRELSRTW